MTSPRILLAALAVSFLGVSTPVRATESAPFVTTTVTEAILRFAGYDDATKEVDALRGTLAVGDTIGFLDMAANNRCVADLLRRAGYLIAAAYVQGRADAFEAAAQLTL